MQNANNWEKQQKQNKGNKNPTVSKKGDPIEVTVALDFTYLNCTGILSLENDRFRLPN